MRRRHVEGMLIPVLALLYCTGYVTGEVCQQHHFWSSFLESCEPCSKCIRPDVVVRPCQADSDTICGPLSDLGLDWSWMAKPTHEGSPQKEMLQTFRENLKQIKQHEAHVLEKQKYLKRKSEDSEELLDGDIVVNDNVRLKKLDPDDVVWEKLKGWGKMKEDNVENDLTALEKQKQLYDYKRLRQNTLLHSDRNSIHLDSDEALELLQSVNEPRKNKSKTYDSNQLQLDEDGLVVKSFVFAKSDDDDVLTDDVTLDPNFTSAEKFVLDWQTVIIGMAVTSVVVFFLVAAIYTVQQAKHWNKLRRYFDADVEELKAWLSTNKESKSKMPSSSIYKTTTEVVHKEGSNCTYLERIINLHGQSKTSRVPSNLYSEGCLSSEMKPLCHNQGLSVHKQLGDRI